MDSKVTELVAGILHQIGQTAQELTDLGTDEARFCSRQVSASKTAIQGRIEEMYGLTIQPSPIPLPGAKPTGKSKVN